MSMNDTTLVPIDISKSKVSKRIVGRPNNGMKRSLRARKVARDVIANIGNGLGKSMKEIILSNGYKATIADNPQKITGTESYKEEMATWTSKIVKLRDKTVEALSNRDLTKEKTFDVTALLKVTDHSTALALGKSTENVAHKSEIVVFGSEDFLSRQLNSGSVKP